MSYLAKEKVKENPPKEIKINPLEWIQVIVNNYNQIVNNKKQNLQLLIILRGKNKLSSKLLDINNY